ncbi:helix-turn-helix domain-containing protein [Ferrovibrio sp.]|uniref:helix-turn-helix domain-containing protein n=1 Tax=Ferrovibrio sp. TaxID=1917215 RepID=UPI003D11B1CF
MLSLERFGGSKFPSSGVLASSASRGWQGMMAELRAHRAGEIPAICPNHMEITLAVDGVAGATVERRGNGQFQSTAVRPGTLWLCPIGVAEDSIRITAPLPRILHLYLPKTHFSMLSGITSRAVKPDEIPYLADIGDDFLRQCGYRILHELESESAGGALFIEHLSMSVALHLASAYTDAPPASRQNDRLGALDRRRLDRVLEYIERNLDNELSLSELAAIACLSPYHFARAFRDTIGIPPHRFVSKRRLKLAQHLLRNTALPLVEIAHTCKFSSQTTFTRAFLRQVGVTPGEYRRGC